MIAHTSNPHAPPPPPPPSSSSPVPTPAQAPTKANLKAWWRQFTFAQRTKKEAAEHVAAQLVSTSGQQRVFGIPLRESLKYASVQISTANANRELYIWGSIPVVVAKCGLYLKENATEVEGTFRVNGSNKRMRDLQAVFETPPKYGKSIDWSKENYTTHDVASVFRRYLTQMPEPVIPHDLYHEFREPIAKKPYDRDEVVATYKRLIRSMPRHNQYLLLYVLDLLSVFARRSDKNLMTATNLAVIFRPGLMSHPDHEMSPQEHQLSQEVLEFLIAQQDWFMLDVPPESERPVSPVSPPPQPEGSWRVLQRGPAKVDRRRTTSEHVRAGTTASVAEESVARTGPSETAPQAPDINLDPVEEMAVLEGGGAVTVTRSRTLPSERTKKAKLDPAATGAGTGAGAAAESDTEQRRRAKVLKKQKRSSVQGPRRPSAQGNDSYSSDQRRAAT